MSLATTLFVAKREIVEMLKSVDDLEGVLISYGFPDNEVGEAEVLWLGTAEADTEIPTMRAGVKRREESVVLNVFLSVWGASMHQIEADERAVELLGHVDYAFRNAPTISTAAAEAGVYEVQVVGWEHEAGSTDVGHGSGFRIRVRIRSRIPLT